MSHCMSGLLSVNFLPLKLVGQLPSPVALGYPLVVANRTDTARNGVGRRRP